MPAGLDQRGRRLWRQIVKAYELSEPELVVLAEACRTADFVDRLAKALADDTLTVTGSRGQPTLNPLAAELRQQRDLLGRLLWRIALPDDDELVTAASALGRRGLRARWAGPRRAGGS